MNKHHKDILQQIKDQSGKATQHTFLDSYLGNDHPRYPISNPVLRKIAKEWMRAHKDLTADEFANLMTSLIEGESSTEKCMAGIMMDYASSVQRKFDPRLFDQWLDHLVGWAEVDSVCTGDYTITEIPSNLKQWRPLLIRFSKSKNIHKRRASLVLLCSPVRHHDDEQLAEIVFENVSRLASEKDGLITKAISWVLRSMVTRHKKTLQQYLEENATTLPAIAVRETRVKLLTGKKTKAKSKTSS